MTVNVARYKELKSKLDDRKVTLVAVSKIKPISDIKALYDLGHRDFGENYVQELVEKQAALPADIRWHFIGHLQSNKVKYIAPFVHLIHGVDRENLLKEINKQGQKNERKIACLLQVHIAQETTKFGFSEDEIQEVIQKSSSFESVAIRGLMGMATFTDDQNQIAKEFDGLHHLFQSLKSSVDNDFSILSMGMSADYELAIDKGSNMVRIGSLLFGAR